MVGFFANVYLPKDAEIGARRQADRDHGLSTCPPAQRLGKQIPLGSSSQAEVKAIVDNAKNLVAEAGGKVPEGFEPAPVQRPSTWLQGYGAVLRGAPKQPWKS